MAENEERDRREEELEDAWETVDESYEVADARKDGAMASVSKHGAVRGNVEASALLEEIAEERGLPPKQYLLEITTRVKQGQVGGIPREVADAPAGSVAVRWYEGKGSPRASFHIGAAFKKHPKLAPSGRTVKALVTKGTASDGKPLLIIAVKAGLSTLTTTRKEDDSSADTQG